VSTGFSISQSSISPMWLLLSGPFPKASIAAMHPLQMDGSDCLSRFHGSKCLGRLILRTREMSISDAPIWLPLSGLFPVIWISSTFPQLLDDPDLSRDFYHGNPQSPILETPDIANADISTPSRLTSTNQCPDLRNG
jgi:hypothetical protein